MYRKMTRPFLLLNPWKYHWSSQVT
uniref:Uncharacterized protein n=1 Tax=Anguilla anguilla TaxID=7936 RepID=A0A0E9S7S9_ANGAN